MDTQVLERTDNVEVIATEIEKASDLHVLRKVAIANVELALKPKQPCTSNLFVGHNQMGKAHDSSQGSKLAM